MMRPRINDLLKAAARDGGTTVRDMRSSTREACVVEARIVFTALAKHHGYRNYEISWAVNKVRQSADYYARRVVAKMADPFFARYINQLLADI